MSYYPESHSNIRDKVKVVLDLSSYATKTELNDATGVSSFNSKTAGGANLATSPLCLF